MNEWMNEEVLEWKGMKKWMNELVAEWVTAGLNE